MSEELIFLPPNEAADAVKGLYFPPYISLAHVFNAPEGWSIGPRTFRQYQIQYVLSGTAVYTIEGHEYETGKGDLIFHSPNETHDVRTLPGHPYVCVSIVFHFGGMPFPLDKWLNGRHYWGNFADEPLEQELTAIPAEFHQPGGWRRLRAQHLLMGVLLELLHLREAQLLRQSGKSDAKSEYHRTKQVLIKNYILSHYANTITYKELEKLSGWSKNYINSRFSQAYGVTPMQFQIKCRIDKAKELAIQTNMSITQIAHAVGYADVHTFGKMFKKKTGLSLSEYCASLIL